MRYCEINLQYGYEPDYVDPRQELAACLSLYRAMINDLHKYSYDDMEVVARLHDRDGIAWALDKLDGQVNPATLQDIEQLDARLRENAKYLVEILDVYGAIGCDQPKSHWWRYLDELAAAESVPAESAATPARMPALALREEEADYQTPDEPGH